MDVYLCLGKGVQSIHNNLDTPTQTGYLCNKKGIGFSGQAELDAFGKDWPIIPGAGGLLLEYSDKLQIIAVGVSSQVVDLAARGLPVGLGADAGVDYCFLVYFSL